MSIPDGWQYCFLCEGLGTIVIFSKMDNEEKIFDCPAYKSFKFIPDYYVVCPHCNGTDKVYINGKDSGPYKSCKLCNSKGYIDFKAKPCTYCNGEGRTWPLANKGGKPKDCLHCEAKGFYPGEKLERKYNLTEKYAPLVRNPPLPGGKQNCFLCEDEGKVYSLHNKKGYSKECPTCKGSKVIEDYYVKCPHCDGTNKIYPDA